MTTATIHPTPERMAKGAWLKPETSQTVKRQYHRSLDLFDRLYNKGDLDQAQYAAALKLRKHYEGGLDRDVRESDDSSGELNDLDGIPARTYHSAKIAEARRNVPDEAWRILEMGLLGCEHLEDLGRFVFRIVNEKTARRRARAAIADGLDILALLWGLAHGPPSR